MRKDWRFKNNKFWQISIFLALSLFVIIFYFFKVAKNYSTDKDLKYPPGFFGVTFSTKFCNELGLDWREVYSATLDDLKVKEIRLPIYWDEIEKSKGNFDFSDYDFIIEEGRRHNVNFIINIGWRLPRWPECHAPAWTNKNSLQANREESLKMIEKVVSHYRFYSNIVYWQVENEPFLDAFGICPPSDIEFFKKEVALVKSLDTRPVMVSSTGELSFWNKEARIGDVFGTTVYRVVWGKWLGYVRYPIPAWFYRLKADLVGLDQSRRYIIELQTEPWVPQGSMIYLPKDEADRSMSFDQFYGNLLYATKINFNKTYLWGVEWWYWKYKNGDDRFWNLAKLLFK
ncbi:MAG: endo-1,4-beta-xylanase [Patescibacteria group bacterium]